MGGDLQCIYVNDTACADGDFAKCMHYFEIQQGTMLLGSLKQALSSDENLRNNMTFYMNVTVLARNYRTKLYGPLNAFSDNSNLHVVRDLVGSASMYIQNNVSC